MPRSILILLYFINTINFGQSKIDSLNKLLDSTAPTGQFEILKSLHDEFKFNDYTKALTYAEQALNNAKLQGDSVKIIEGGQMVAFSLIDLAKNQQALNLLDTCLQIAKRNEKRLPQVQPKIKSILNNMGIAAMYLAQYDRALSYNFQSLILREEEGDKKSIANALNNIALTYNNLRDFENSLKYFNQALAVKQEVNDLTNLDIILTNIGLCYVELNQYVKAIEAINQALSLCGDNCRKIVLMYAYYCKGEVFFSQGQLTSAEASYLISLKISEELHEPRYSMLCLIQLSQIEFAKKNIINL